MNPKSTYLKIGILIIIANILIIYGWWWFFNKINKEKESILNIRTAFKGAETKINNLKHLENILDSVEEDSRLIANSFIDEKNLVLFIQELERVADTANVELEVVGASVPTSIEELGPKFIINVSGDFDDVYRYIALLQKVPNQILFDKLYIYQTKSQDANEEFWRAQIELKILSYTFSKK